MRIMVFFDLPTLTSKDMREYRRFRKYLIKTGFIMNQESVYSKLALNTTVANAVIKNIKKNKPEAGLVQMLCVTEIQYSKMEYIIGSKKTGVLDDDKRLVVI